MSESKYKVPNLERALQIMEHLQDFAEGLSVSEIARSLEIPNNSAYRICNTLADRAYLERNESSKKFALGNKLYLMSQQTQARKTLLELAQGVMKEFRDEYKETVCLSILSRGEGIIIDEVPGLHPFRFVCDIGTTQALHASASTKALLAFLPKEKQASWLKPIQYEALTKNTIANAKDLKAELKLVRKQGFSLDLAQCLDGVYCVSAPILNAEGEAIASVTITGPAPRLSKEMLEQIGPRLSLALLELSGQLGYEEKNK